MLLHLIYIHGFQGNDTTFQSFPTDLQQHLNSRSDIPPHIQIHSSLYPTYKSVKPISQATRNFLEWLVTQPDGPVILIGHSMGGLLAAEAATHPSNRRGQIRRVVAMIAFDTPYLGMHPHVVISGIASLFPKQSAKDETKTNRTMNDENEVSVVDESVTDDWESSKRRDTRRSLLHVHDENASKSQSSTSFNLSPSPTPSIVSTSAGPPSPAMSFTSSTSTTSQNPLLQLLPVGAPPKLVDYISKHANDPFIRWLGKHSGNPLGAGKRWIIEHFQFGSCMFDPPGLRERYRRLVEWDGEWINYWTITASPASPGQSKKQRQQVAKENDVALLANGVLAPSDVQAAIEAGGGTGDLPDTLSMSTASSRSSSPVPTVDVPAATAPLPLPQLPQGQPTKSEAGKAHVAAERHFANYLHPESPLKGGSSNGGNGSKKEKPHKASKHHFIVLPNGLGSILGGSERWERIEVAAAPDEVAAHTGLFMRHQNLEYEKFVSKVGDWIEGVCKKLA